MLEQMIVDAINNTPDAARLFFFPMIRVVASYFGLTLWEDGSVG